MCRQISISLTSHPTLNHSTRLAGQTWLHLVTLRLHLKEQLRPHLPILIAQTQGSRCPHPSLQQLSRCFMPRRPSIRTIHPTSITVISTTTSNSAFFTEAET